MRRRRTLFAIMACYALEQTNATSCMTDVEVGSLKLSHGSTVIGYYNNQKPQNVAFLFSMLKRRRRRTRDDVTEDRLKSPLQPHDVLIEHPPARNGFHRHIFGATKHEVPSSLYFATPPDNGRVNGDGLSSSSDDHISLLQLNTTTNNVTDARVSPLENSSLENSLATIVESSITEQENSTYFKASLLTGLEVQTAAHRTRLLSDLLEGVKEGVMNAVDTEKEKIWFNEEKVRFWQFWRRGSAVTSAVTAEVDDFDANTLATQGEVDLSDPTLPISQHTKEENEYIQSSKFASRTITGLINALAQEVKDLEVKVDSDPTTPLSNKTIHSIQIYFSRLGFQQLKMGDRSTSEPSTAITGDKGGEQVERVTADEAFDRIDVDQSGALDAEELASALKMAALMGGSKSGSYIGIRSKEMLSEMATRLIKIYDANGDGVVDREEYAVLVRDMAFLREKRLSRVGEQSKMLEEERQKQEKGEHHNKRGWLGTLFSKQENTTTTVLDDLDVYSNETDISENMMDVTENEVFWTLVDQGEGSIVLEDLRLDLRRLVFGAFPVFKRLLPGGHLILKPFTATITASFNREDIMNSFLVDAGLRRLVARALSLRVRSVRDLFDGAVFYGRTWKLFEQNAPLVEVPKLEDVQFDSKNRLVITGRAKIKAAPDAPFIENGFKVRTKIGTGSNGRIIGLLEPEIAVFAECPKAMESRIKTLVKDWFDYTIPTLQPLYTFIPLQSPFKEKDKVNGFNLGEDNQIKSIEIKNGKFCFEFRAILRPGRFLGSHYLAFTVPIRTLIITLDRVKEGIRTARRNKRMADKDTQEHSELLNDETCDDECAMNEVLAQSISGKSSLISTEGRERLQKLEADFQAVEEEIESKEIQKSFISRFVEGYSGARDDEDSQLNARLSNSISNFFGSQNSDKHDNDS